MFARRGESFLREFRVEARRPADVVARIDRERRRRNDNKGRIRDSLHNWFVLTNRGEADARNVAFRLRTSDGEEARMPRVMIENHPIKNLRGGTEITFPASVAMGPGRASEVKITWEDVDGDSHSVTQSLSA